MPSTAARKKRTERFNVRLSEREARLIRLGAEQRGVNITNFILESACVRAAQEIAEARHFELRCIQHELPIQGQKLTSFHIGISAVFWPRTKLRIEWN